MRNIIFLIIDSARYDNFVKAKLKNIIRLGAIEKRYSYASWTSPSHYVLLMGLMPHKNPTKIFASEVYKNELSLWTQRIGTELSFKNFVPELSLPKVLKTLGYKTVAKVSLPVLNKFTGFSAFFDEYKLMDKHNDFAGMVDEIEFNNSHPYFYFLNVGEAHYPYVLPGENPLDYPKIHGVHGVFKHIDDLVNHAGDQAQPDKQTTFFNKKMLKTFKKKQILCIEYVDGLMGKLFNKCPANTCFIVTSDHGELFGEKGFFGHGPIMHKKVFEVPFVEGILR